MSMQPHMPPPPFPNSFPSGPPGPYYPPQAPPSGALNISSMVTGLLSLLLCWTTWPALLLGIPAIVLGAVGKYQADRGKASNGGLGITGIILGIVGVVLTIIWISLLSAGVEWISSYKMMISLTLS